MLVGAVSSAMFVDSSVKPSVARLGRIALTAFGERLSALSRVQSLLSRSDAGGISFGALVRLELEALGTRDRVTIEGPTSLPGSTRPALPFRGDPRAADGNRTHDLLLTKEVLYQLSYSSAVK